MALKYIELEDGRVRDVNSVEQMYQIDVKVSDEPPKRTQYWDWDKANAVYREALEDPNVEWVDLGVYKLEFVLESEDFKELDCDV